MIKNQYLFQIAMLWFYPMNIQELSIYTKPVDSNIHIILRMVVSEGRFQYKFTSYQNLCKWDNLDGTAR